MNMRPATQEFRLNQAGLFFRYKFISAVKGT